MTRAQLLEAGAALSPDASPDELSRFLHAVNAWGYGTTGYGPARTLGVARAPNFVDSARYVVSLLRRTTEDAAVEAYFYLNNAGHVHGWGPSFFTKFMAFADPANQPNASPGREPAQILDRWTAQSMNWIIQKHHATSAAMAPVPIASFKRWSWRTPQYAFYLRLLGRLARDPRFAHWPSHGSHLATERVLFAYFRDGEERQRPVE